MHILLLIKFQTHAQILWAHTIYSTHKHKNFCPAKQSVQTHDLADSFETETN